LLSLSLSRSQLNETFTIAHPDVPAVDEREAEEKENRRPVVSFVDPKPVPVDSNVPSSSFDVKKAALVRKRPRKKRIIPIELRCSRKQPQQHNLVSEARKGLSRPEGRKEKNHDELSQILTSGGEGEERKEKKPPSTPSQPSKERKEAKHEEHRSHRPSKVVPKVREIQEKCERIPLARVAKEEGRERAAKRETETKEAVRQLVRVHKVRKEKKRVKTNNRNVDPEGTSSSGDACLVKPRKSEVSDISLLMSSIGWLGSSQTIHA
jgi:hypothetical protein